MRMCNNVLAFVINTKLTMCIIFNIFFAHILTYALIYIHINILYDILKFFSLYQCPFFVGCCCCCFVFKLFLDIFMYSFVLYPLNDSIHIQIPLVSFFCILLCLCDRDLKKNHKINIHENSATLLGQMKQIYTKKEKRTTKI